MDIDVKKLMLDAYEDLQKVTDPYQHGMLAATIYNSMKGESIELPVTNKQNLENRPIMKSEKKELSGMTKESEAIAKVMTEAAEKTEAAPAEEEKIELAPAIEPTAEPEAEAKPENDEAYYDTDEWKQKHLTYDELDDDWTPRMQKNEQLASSYKDLLDLVKKCVGSKNVSNDWLNQTISSITSGHHTDYRDKKLYTPRMVLIMLPGLKMALYNLMQSMTANKAA